MSTKQVWLITAKTNLHAGNENTSSYGLIDKAIQRDALTNLPCINSSSLKGALNEFCSQATEVDSESRIKIFGGDKNDKTKATQKGAYTFFDANILLLPTQDDQNLYRLITCDNVLDLCMNKINALGIEFKKETLKRELGLNTNSIVSSKEFESLCSDDNLPIIARNCLENGISSNLWYEQILPAETVFFTIIDSADNTLTEALNNKIVQIGANATIGYGYCKFTKL